MIENQDIVQGAITKTKLSKNLRLDLTNLPKGTAGQIPVVQADGNWGLVDLSGDISIAENGVTTVVNNATINAADIDVAFNFLTNERGFVFRKGEQDYAVDNKNYATETVAAAHANHAANTSVVSSLGTQTESPLAIDGFSDEYISYLLLGTNLRCDNSDMNTVNDGYLLFYVYDESGTEITGGYDDEAASTIGETTIMGPMENTPATIALWIMNARETQSAYPTVLFHGTMSSITTGGSHSGDDAFWAGVLDWSNSTPSTAAANRKVSKICIKAIEGGSIVSTAVTGTLKLYGFK